MKIRIKFRKNGVMKFIGHLDIMRYFQKAIKRADIAICYTGGFSPHMIMSFASPLGVGITSDGEYFIDSNFDEICQKLMELLPLTSLEYIMSPDMEAKLCRTLNYGEERWK